MSVLLKTVACARLGQIQNCNQLVKLCSAAFSCVRHTSTDSKQTNESTTTKKTKTKDRMKAWCIYGYGGNEELSLTDTMRVPVISRPTDILIEVKAASVNPIDVEMRGGYGRTIINRLRAGLNVNVDSEFPLILGRDFSGVILETGKNVSRFKRGDEVWGALAASRQGTHAQYTIAGEQEISLKPKTLSHTEAASIPYVATTVWSALCVSGGLNKKNTASKRVLIHGGSGGIGTFAIQLMKAWGADVTTTCATDAADLVHSLGPNTIIDYKVVDVSYALHQQEKYDLVLDPLGGKTPSFSMYFLKPWKNSKYVSLVSPLMRQTDQFGLVGGAATSGVMMGFNVLQGLTRGRSFRWGFFVPNGSALATVAKMVDKGDIRPVIDEVMPLEKIPDAFTKVGKRHGRGKTVIEINV